MWCLPAVVVAHSCGRPSRCWGYQCSLCDQTRFWGICTKVGRGQDQDEVQRHRTDSSRSFRETGRKVPCLYLGYQHSWGEPGPVSEKWWKACLLRGFCFPTERLVLWLILTGQADFWDIKWNEYWQHFWFNTLLISGKSHSLQTPVSGAIFP